ncbi:MAG: leucine-rich repeat protein [Clostridia bacterium]|nr:leucine-rich repeat protein [Clostridia bacterium]
MKLVEKIKSVPKKKLIIVGVLVVLIIATVVITFTVANQRKNESALTGEQGDSSSDGINVFKSDTQKDTSKVIDDTVEPIDMSGVNGLEYVSKGDGTCSISGIGTCISTELKIPAYSPSGDIVTKITDGAFSNCTEILTITIPATIKTIGTGVFRGCSSLVSINVDSENSVYTSIGGVLMSKDKTVLVCFPMNKPGANYLLSTDIKAVAAYAFEGALNLKNLLYEGSISDYQKIDFLMGNGTLDKVAITCNYISAK